jgi:hypothetical protein
MVVSPAPMLNDCQFRKAEDDTLISSCEPVAVELAVPRLTVIPIGLPQRQGVEASMIATTNLEY